MAHDIGIWFSYYNNRTVKVTGSTDIEDIKVFDQSVNFKQRKRKMALNLRRVYNLWNLWKLKKCVSKSLHLEQPDQSI